MYDFAKTITPNRTRGTRNKRVARQGKQANPSITLSEQDGIRYLHFGTEWVQGAMRVSRPYELVLEYQQQMLALGCLLPQPSRILLLGLGAAALAKFCWKFCGASKVTTVEISPSVIEATRQWFYLPQESEPFEVVIDDAQSYIRHPQHRGQADWLLVDLYDSEARGPVYDSVSFYEDCYRSLSDEGVASFNLFGHYFRDSCQAISDAFNGQFLTMPETEAGNCVVLGYKGRAFNQAREQMGRRAADLQRRWKLPFKKWLANTVSG